MKVEIIDWNCTISTTASPEGSAMEVNTPKPALGIVDGASVHLGGAAMLGYEQRLAAL